jgi:prepilin-type N-terminal cleavage/methylation domain-containing protein
MGIPQRAPSRRPAPVRAGITLIEIMIVIVVIGLVAAVAMPRFNLEGYKVTAAARGITAALSYAQRLAVTLQHNVVVAFDSAGSQIRVHEDDNNNGVIDPGERVTSTPLENGVVFGRGSAAPLTYTTGASGTQTFNFTLSQGGLPAITFRRDGSASENGGFYLDTRKGLSINNTNWVRAGEVIRSTGRVIWYNYATGAWVQGN